jgi:hypothetical protein
MIGFADAHDGLYYLKLEDKSAHVHAADGTNNITIPTQAVWHFRLGHLSLNRMHLLHKQFPYIIVDNKGVCDICHLAKHKKLPYANSMNKADKPFDMIHFDIWGPINTKSLHGHSYFLTAVDDYSIFTWITLMKHKSEARKHLKDFIQLIETQHNSKVKVIRTDNGVEFIMLAFYASKGIMHHTSCVESPEQNGRVERKHQHLLNIGRSLLYQAKIPKMFWSYAIQHATFFINRILTPYLDNKSPYEMMNNNLPDLTNLKVFGSLAYASTLHAHRTKLEPRSRTCIFLGYKSGVKGTILYDLNSKEILVSRNVIHHDHILPYAPASTTPNWHYHVSFSPPDTTYQSIPSDTNEPASSDHDTPDEPTIPSTTINTPNTHNTQNDPQIINTSTQANIPARPVRAKHVPSYLSDYVCNQSHTSLNSSSKGSIYPISDYHLFSQLSHRHHAYTTSVTHTLEL